MGASFGAGLGDALQVSAGRWLGSAEPGLLHCEPAVRLVQGWLQPHDVVLPN